MPNSEDRGGSGYTIDFINITCYYLVFYYIYTGVLSLTDCITDITFQDKKLTKWSGNKKRNRWAITGQNIKLYQIVSATVRNLEKSVNCTQLWLPGQQCGVCSSL